MHFKWCWDIWNGLALIHFMKGRGYWITLDSDGSATFCPWAYWDNLPSFEILMCPLNYLNGCCSRLDFAYNFLTQKLNEIELGARAIHTGKSFCGSLVFYSFWSGIKGHGCREGDVMTVLEQDGRLGISDRPSYPRFLHTHLMWFSVSFSKAWKWGQLTTAIANQKSKFRNNGYNVSAEGGACPNCLCQSMYIRASRCHLLFTAVPSLSVLHQAVYLPNLHAQTSDFSLRDQLCYCLHFVDLCCLDVFRLRADVCL